MMTTTNSLTNAQKIRENAKRDHSPKWDDATTWSAEQFTEHFHNAMNYYNAESSPRDLKVKVIQWMKLNGFDENQIIAFKNSKDWRCNITMGATACCLLKGMPPSHPGFNHGRDSVEWLTQRINQVISQSKEDDSVKPTKKTQPTEFTVQDRIFEQAVEMCQEIDYAIDKFIADPDKFDSKLFKVQDILRSASVKAAQARYIKTFFESGHAELAEVANGSQDEQLLESYHHLSRRNIKELINFYKSIDTACEQIIAENKVIKQLRIKKVKPADELIKKLKFKISDDSLGIASIPPSQIIGAQGLVIYNTATRKLGYYIATNSDGFGVKGSALTNYTEKSMQRTLRKPAEQLKEFNEQNTPKKFSTWFEKNVTTMETALSGKFNEDIIILRLFK
jgi:hypothetical protein